MEKRCLIIDNNDQSAEIEKLVRDGKSKGLTIECYQFNVGSTFDVDLLTDGKISIEKVISEFKKRFKKVSFNLVAFDWDLSDPEINGLELLRQFEHSKLIRNTDKLLYTGLLADRLSSMLDAFKSDELTKTALLAHIKTLIKIDIKDFVGRENYEQDIIRLLEKSEDSIDLIIEGELRKFPELRFRNSFVSDHFNGKTFLEISEILENDDRLRNDFKREIIQQVIAYLTEQI